MNRLMLVALVIGCGGGGSNESPDAGLPHDADVDAAGDAAPPNNPPSTTAGALSVEVGGFVAGRMLATDPEGDALTFAVTGTPTQGTVAWFHAGTGALGYKPTATAPATDAVTFTASDGVNAPVAGSVAIDIVAFDFLRPWIVTEINGGACANTTMTLVRTANTLDVSSRAYRCGSTTTTMTGRSFDIVGTNIFADGKDVGDLSATGLTITQSGFVSGCGTVTQSLTVTQTTTGYSIVDTASAGTCAGTRTFSGTLRRGAHLVVIGEGAFGKVQYPGPATRTFVLANDGDMAATAVGVSGLAAPFTNAGGTCAGTLAPETYCTIDLAAGGMQGTHAKTLSASYNNGASATATPFDVSVEIWRPATVEVSPTAIEFGVHDRLKLPASRMLALTNVGTYPAKQLAATVGGAFAIGTGGTCTQELAPGASCDLEIAFTTTTKGTYSSSLALAYHDGVAAKTASVAVTGIAANFLGYGFNAAYGSYGVNRIVPYYDLGGFGAPIATSPSSAYWKEIAYDAGTDLFFVTNRHTAVSQVTRAGAVTNITPSLSWPTGAAVDTSRNRLVILGSGAYAQRDLATGAWATTTHAVLRPETMVYRPGNDTFVAIDAGNLDDGYGSVRVLAGATAAQQSNMPIDLTGIRDTYFDTYTDYTHALASPVNDKVYLVGQLPWWSTGAKAAAGAPSDVNKTALYELDLATNKLSLVWDMPANVVQPASTKVLHGIGVYESIGGNIDVTVSTGKTTVLVLSSYSAVNWRITVSAGTTLEKVIVRGLYASTVQGTGTAQIDNTTSSVYGYAGSDATRLRYMAENIAGIAMSSFQGAYRQEAFTVGP